MLRLIKRLFSGQPETGPPAMPDQLPEVAGVVPERPVAAFLDRNFRFVAVDVETANSNQHSICQIGLALVDDAGQIETFSIYVDPGERFDPFNTRLHGIDEGTVRGSLKFPEAQVMLRSFMDRHQLIQHSNFDKAAFAAACQLHGMPHLTCTWRDSVQIARRAWPDLKANGGHGLANLKKVLSLEFRHHDAGEDARAAAMVVLRAEAALGMPFDQILDTPAVRRSFPKAVKAAKSTVTGHLTGGSVCFTGKLSMTREAAALLALSAGLDVKTTVGAKVTYLVVGDQDLTLLAGHEKSTKHRKAEELIAAGKPIRILSETEFTLMVVANTDTDGE